MNRPDIPWTVAAHVSYLSPSQQVPGYRIDELREHQPVPDEATFYSKEMGRWRTLADIRNPALVHHVLRVARDKGRTIQPETLRKWEREWQRQDLSAAISEAVGDALEQSRDLDNFIHASIVDFVINRLRTMPVPPVRKMEV